MRALFDTHAFIWWDGAPEQLGARARQVCFAPGNQLILSVASLWEMQIKFMAWQVEFAKASA
jgi:PIN domain nuclease of toxin-antitoxin system